MSGNTFGRLFRLTTYGESHGPGLGGVVDGCPAGLPLAEADIQRELDARRPGRSGPGAAASTARNEPDRVRLLSGVYEGRTTGTPIAFHIENTDHKSGDYSKLAEVFRPGHADLPFQAKYGRRDPRGGGRSSGRETVGRVAGGAVALALLARAGIAVRAWSLELGGVVANPTDPAGAASRPYFAPEDAVIPLWEERLAAVRGRGDTVGGLVRVEAFGLPPGLGEPVFDKLDARLAYALMGVGAVKAVEIGAGFGAARMTGAEHNDPVLALPPEETNGPGAHCRPILPDAGTGYDFASNNAGGTLGGMSSGAPLCLTVAVKPIPSIATPQRTVTRDGAPAEITVGGRHDIAAIPRIVPVLKAMTALVLADFLLLQRSARLDAATARGRRP